MKLKSADQQEFIDRVAEINEQCRKYIEEYKMSIVAKHTNLKPDDWVKLITKKNGTWGKDIEVEFTIKEFRVEHIRKNYGKNDSVVIKFTTNEDDKIYNLSQVICTTEGL